MFEQVLNQIKETLDEHGVKYDEIIEQFGQVAAWKSRKAGMKFGLDKHAKGLIYAQLSNQRPWGPIARNLQLIDKIFYDYDPEILKKENPQKLVKQLKDIKCGNRKIAAQMKNLQSNILKFEEIITHYGSMDAFVTSDDPYKIAKELGQGNTYKIKEIGFTLAMEYLRNIGISVIKPDVHIRRFIGPQRLALLDTEPTPEQAYDCLMDLEDKTSMSAVYLDNLIWIFASKDYGNICSSSPKCDKCRVTFCLKNNLTFRQTRNSI